MRRDTRFNFSLTSKCIPGTHIGTPVRVWVTVKTPSKTYGLAV